MRMTASSERRARILEYRTIIADLTKPTVNHIIYALSTVVSTYLQVLRADSRTQDPSVDCGRARISLAMGAVVSMGAPNEGQGQGQGLQYVDAGGFHALAPTERCAVAQARRRAVRGRPAAVAVEGGTPQKPRGGRGASGARGQVSSPVFERPDDSPGRENLLPLEKPAQQSREASDRAKPRTRRSPVLPPVLADRPCNIDAMPKERRQLYVNVPCCGGQGCPQCSLVSLGFR